MNQNTPDLFNNGIEFVYPKSVHGPSLYGLLEAVWLLAALAKGARQRVWENAELHKADPIAGAWARAGLITVDVASKRVQLTEEGVNVAACVELLEYELEMVQRQLSGVTETDPAMYEKLRRGLHAYTLHFLPEMLEWVRSLLPVDGNTYAVLDYCGGDGAYIEHVCSGTAYVDGWLIDKAPGRQSELARKVGVNVRQGNVLEDPELTSDLGGFFDMIIMSEILHCQGMEGRATMIGQAYTMLKPGGQLIVIEQFPGKRMDWRLFDMTKSGQTLVSDQVAYEVQALPFKPVSYIEAISHYGIQFIKETPQ